MHILLKNESIAVNYGLASAFHFLKGVDAGQTALWIIVPVPAIGDDRHVRIHYRPLHALI